MVTADQLKAGITSYIDVEILPRIDGYKRYGLMVYMALLMDGFQSKVVDLMRTPALSILGVMDDTGHFDIDKLHDAAYTAMRETVDVIIPYVGKFTFSRDDVDKICDMIRRA